VNLSKVEIPVPSITMLLPHSEQFVHYGGDLSDLQQLGSWIRHMSMPAVFNFDHNSFTKILDTPGAARFFVFFHSAGEGQDMAKAALFEVAQLLRGRANIIVSGTHRRPHRQLMKVLGVQDEDIPCAYLWTPRNDHGRFDVGVRYRFVGEIRRQSVLNFFENFESGKLEPYMRSEVQTLPAAVTFDGVHKVVGASFHATTHNPEKDILMNVYVNWSGLSQKFKPVYKKLAEQLMHVTTLQIMHIDGDGNDVIGLNGNLPTLWLFPAGSKGLFHQHYWYFQGEIPSIVDLVQWANKYVTYPFSDAPFQDTSNQVEYNGPGDDL